MNWYIKVLQNYAVFSGRARRKEYWMFVLFNMIVSIALAVIEGVIGGPGIAVIIYSLAVMIPSIAVAVRRLHDTSRSGWWIFITLIPLIGSIVILIFLVLDSAEGDNDYGANPKMAEA